MKKLIVSLFAFILLLVGQSVFAAPLSYVSWNNASGDCPDINIKNGNVGGGNPCWTGVNITAVPGNNIDVKIYYHNTGNATAHDTRIKVIPSPEVGEPATVHSFIGKILSNEANHTSDGNVTVTIPSSESLSFVSTTWWTKPNPNSNYLVETPLLNNQDGDEVLGLNGLRIGDISPGWGTQGAVTVRFHINNTPPPSCTINNFDASPDTVGSGQLSVLSWNTSNCEYSKVFKNNNQQIGNIHYGSNGSQNVWPTDTTTYTLKSYNSDGTVGDTAETTVTVNVPPQNCSIDYFTATPTHINIGGSSNLEWDTTNCNTTKLSVGLKSFGVYGSSGSRVVSPIITTTYTLKAYKTDGTLGDTKTVKVTINTTTPDCSITDFYATPNHIDEGDSSTLKWTVSNCAYTKLFINDSQIGGPYYGTTGSKVVSPEDTTTYTLKAYKQNGTVGAIATAIVNVSTTITPTCSISNFTADPTTIQTGESSILEWNTNGCDNTKLFIGYTQIGEYGASGSKTVSPEHETTYILKAYVGGVQKATSSVTVDIATQNCKITFFYALPTNIIAGESSVLNWDTSDCFNTKLFIGYTQIGTYEPSEALTVWPEHTTTYTLKAYNQNGTLGDTATAKVEVNIPASCAINNFTANPTSIDQGESSTLSWNTSNCVDVTISNVNDSLPTSGSTTVWPEETTTYVLTATGQGGDTHTRSVTVYVDTNNSNCSIYSFYATPSSINSGQSSRLYWTTSGCTSVNIEGIGQVQSSGSRTIWPTYTRTYTLNAEDHNGIGVSAQTTVYVDDNNDSCEIINFDASDTSIEDGDETTLEWDTNNCDRVNISHVGNVSDSGERDVSPSTDTTYVLTAYDYDGSHETESVRIYVDEYGNDNDDECTIDSFTASDTYIDRGDEVNLRWRTTDCDDVSITNVGDVSDDGNEYVSPYQTMTYTLRAYGNGSDSKSIRINVNNGVIDDGVYNTYAITTVATNISQTGAQLNGLLTGQNYSGGDTYFEYGTNINLGMRTASRITTGGNTFSEYVTNLSPGTIYYFRAVAEGSYGVSYGAIEVFQTLRYQNGNNTQIIRQVIQGPTIAGSESPIMLQIENRYQTISVGDAINYTIFYKNISSSRLSNPMVQVFLPEGIEFVNSSRGTYSEGDKTLSVPIEDLDPSDEGTIYIEAVVKSIDRNMAQIVTTAVLIYTNPNGAQENAMAYVLNSPRNGSVLGASAFFGNILGMNLIGWLLLIIIILLIILITRSYYGRRNLIVSPFHAEKNHL